jgi:hypothetical protein
MPHDTGNNGLAGGDERGGVAVDRATPPAAISQGDILMTRTKPEKKDDTTELLRVISEFLGEISSKKDLVIRGDRIVRLDVTADALDKLEWAHYSGVYAAAGAVQAANHSK